MEKTFEALEKIAVHMATTVWPDYSHEAKTGKLEEEFAELMEQLTYPCVETAKLKDEMADVLFVLLQMANKFGFTGSDLIHHATNKLLQRIKDPKYNRD